MNSKLLEQEILKAKKACSVAMTKHTQSVEDLTRIQSDLAKRVDFYELLKSLGYQLTDQACAISKRRMLKAEKAYSAAMVNHYQSVEELAHIQGHLAKLLYTQKGIEIDMHRSFPQGGNKVITPCTRLDEDFRKVFAKGVAPASNPCGRSCKTADDEGKVGLAEKPDHENMALAKIVAHVLNGLGLACSEESSEDNSLSHEDVSLLLRATVNGDKLIGPEELLVIHRIYWLSQ